ncbi:hydroxymethylbilane synthase [Gulosibacter bifidus]|uniref:Porphobilinogen deaminase n=1 Tax=Gulosibacter bifidus TaxID=272239 RepID=A0ABW5RJK1_9MICO|nr:hydroxymethylbilane synthase [Gulosibacter bifidus]
MTPAPLRIGTRGSKLAVAQTTQIAERIADAAGREFEIARVSTHGDVNRASLKEIGGQGVFATELREALAAGEVDIAVHSLKDLPTVPAPGLVLAAHPERADARDVLVARDGLGLADLPAGARVGTGSPRRIAQLRRARPDVTPVDIRGNIDTRIGFVTSGELDAVVLAAAGLVRFDRERVITEMLPLDVFPTAPGQGALAVEVREGFELDALGAVDCAATRTAVEAERAVLNGLDAGCQAPVGVHAEVVDGVLSIHGVVYGLDAGQSTRCEARATGPVTLPAPATGALTARPMASDDVLAVARLVVEDLLQQGAGRLIAEPYA